ncbi:MAG: 3'-5' exonuclease [Crocinitomicaceae bacterium]|nr:3'-5' exonuclease [Crocinitomicaceae bacterium]MBK8926250.1 3'-5' exonuclease [Crocinitomicaceae bacterium]
MQLNLTKPLAFFDLETTGLNISKDRIIEIAILKVHPDQTEERYVKRVNPGMAIPADSTEIHGITDADVKDAPQFSQIAEEIKTFIGQADLAGYNSNKFDIPFLLEEFLRIGIELEMEDRKFIDVQTIFHKMEQRTLSAAYKFYCHQEMQNAHSAEADIVATFEILKAQLEKYGDIKNDILFLSEFTQTDKNRKIDFVGRLALNDKKEIMYNFGKHAGKTIREVYQLEPGYHRWILDNEFPLYTKSIVKKETDKLITANREQKEKKKEVEEQKFTDKLSQLKNKFGS